MLLLTGGAGAGKSALLAKVIEAARQELELRVVVAQVSFRTLGRRTAPLPPFLIPQDPGTDVELRVVVAQSSQMLKNCEPLQARPALLGSWDTFQGPSQT